MKKTLRLGLVLSMSLAATIFQGCQMQDTNNAPAQSKVIENSTEFEEFVMASIELHQAYLQFEKQLSKVDFRKLETTVDADGMEMKKMPFAVSSIDIESKEAALTAKKKILLESYPEIASLDKKTLNKRVNDCIKNSTRINDLFLSYGINILLPKSRYNVNEYYHYDSMNDLQGHIYNWTYDSDYVEVAVYFFEDGTAAVYRDAKNGYNQQTGNYECEFSMTQRRYSDGTFAYFVDNKKVVGMGHTHKYNGSDDPGAPTNPDDYDLKSLYPGIDHYIYYDGYFHSY